MTTASLAHLRDLFVETDDPWDFRGSAYEAERLAAITQALPQRRYGVALEVGCGNGELACLIAPRCTSYTGIDAVPAALEAARIALPSARFVEAFLPCRLPDPMGQPGYELVLLSEILYCLNPITVARIAEELDQDHPTADVVTVTWRGQTGQALSGDDAVAVFADASRRHARAAWSTEGYRIEIFAPLGATPL